MELYKLQQQLPLSTCITLVKLLGFSYHCHFACKIELTLWKIQNEVFIQNEAFISIWHSTFGVSSVKVIAFTVFSYSKINVAT